MKSVATGSVTELKQNLASASLNCAPEMLTVVYHWLRAPSMGSHVLFASRNVTFLC